jgi:LacI family transcriptional regulator
MATQKDVADRAGVSFITVSRVVNRLGNVRPETQARVEQAIRELRYYPNRQAQALNQGLTRTLGLVTPRMFDRPLFDNFYVMNLLSGVEMRGRELGWDVLMSTDYDQGGSFDFLRVWHQRKVDGLIFVGLGRIPDEQLAEIEGKGIPVVILSDRVASPAVSWVDTRSDEAVADAVDRLMALGHRRFAFLGVNPAGDYNPNFRDRERAVRDLAASRGLDLEVFSGSGMHDAGEETLRQYLEGSRTATAIISGNDSVALTFMAGLAQAGLECPRDFSIVGFDAEPVGRIHRPTLASYRQPLVDMGQAAVTILIDRLGGRRDRVEQTFPLEFVPGDSLGPVPRR